MLALVLRLGVLARGFVSDDESIALVCPTELRERTCVGGPVFRRVGRANFVALSHHAAVVFTGRLS
jgi:hypothetical protein